MDLTRRALLSLPRSQPAATTEGYWLHLRREAMACRFEVTLPSELQDWLDAAKDALDAVDRLEDQLSIFRDTSDLSRINRTAAGEPVAVDERLMALLVQCRELHRITGGTFDITSTPLSRVWGFLKREGRVPGDAELSEARALVGMDRVVALDEGAGTIRLAAPGVSLNLGSIGKGYALDRVSEEMARAGVATALLTAGASSILAFGGGPDGQGYLVGLRDPNDHERRLGTVRLTNAALGVSGVGEQSFASDGRRFGHILDPRTGWPVEGRAYAAVVAPTAALADALATAFFVGGRAVAEQYVKSHPEVSALVMDMDSAGAPGQGQRHTAPPGRRIPANKDQHMAVIGSTSVWSFSRAP
jgi:thiamine biosynthesis lipoprotein